LCHATLHRAKPRVAAAAADWSTEQQLQPPAWWYFPLPSPPSLPSPSPPHPLPSSAALLPLQMLLLLLLLLLILMPLLLLVLLVPLVLLRVLGMVLLVVVLGTPGVCLCAWTDNDPGAAPWSGVSASPLPSPPYAAALSHSCLPSLRIPFIPLLLLPSSPPSSVFSETVPVRCATSLAVTGSAAVPLSFHPLAVCDRLYLLPSLPLSIGKAVAECSPNVSRAGATPRHLKGNPGCTVRTSSSFLFEIASMCFWKKEKRKAFYFFIFTCQYGGVQYCLFLTCLVSRSRTRGIGALTALPTSVSRYARGGTAFSV